MDHETNGKEEASVRRKRRGVAILPTLFTLGNCLSGFVSINYAAQGMTIDAAGKPDFSNYAIAGYCVFAAMFFDMFDGFVARLTKSASDFGAELDSLADMVSFGLAPAFLSIRVIGDLVHKQNLPAGMRTLEIPGPLNDDVWGRLFWVIAALYVCCTALRLARFNVLNKHEVSNHMNFRGMPSPGAAACVASSVVFFCTLYAQKHIIWFNMSDGVKEFLQTVFPYILPIVLLVAALLMVSRFAYAHLVNRFLRGRRRFRMVVVYLGMGLLIIALPQVTSLVLIYFYALSAPVGWMWRECTRRRVGTT